jgi:hypothetical protein
MRRSLASVCACAVVLGSACSPKAAEQQQGSSASATARPPRAAVAAKRDPCSLVTAAEMSEVLAFVVQAKPDGDTCDYQNQNPGGDGFGAVEVSWENDNAGQALLEALRQSGKLAPVPGAEPQSLAGIGDGATYSMYALHVLKGDVLLTFRVSPPPTRLMDLLKQGKPPQQASDTLSSEILAKEKVLAQKALARL